MLGIDHPRARGKEAEPGANPGLFRVERRDSIQRPASAEVYPWVTRTLGEQRYGKQERAGQGRLRQCLGKMTGLTRAHAAPLLSQ